MPLAIVWTCSQSGLLVARRELFSNRVQSWVLNALGAFPVDRGAGDNEMIETAKAILARGDIVLIFPEGTRTAVGSQRPYQVGTAALYRQLGVPVVPVALNSGLFWGRRQFIKWPGVIDVEVLPAIPPGLGRKAFMATLREHIEGATARLVAAARPRNE